MRTPIDDVAYVLADAALAIPPVALETEGRQLLMYALSDALVTALRDPDGRAAFLTALLGDWTDPVLVARVKDTIRALINEERFPGHSLCGPCPLCGRD